MSTIKNGKYSDAERARLTDYDHPEYGPAMAPAGKRSYTKGELGDRATNEQAGRWRGDVDKADY